MITVNDYRKCMVIEELASKAGFRFHIAGSVCNGAWQECFVLSPVHECYVKDCHLAVFADLDECITFIKIWRESRWNKAEEDRYDAKKVIEAK